MRREADERMGEAPIPAYSDDHVHSAEGVLASGQTASDSGVQNPTIRLRRAVRGNVG